MSHEQQAAPEPGRIRQGRVRRRPRYGAFLVTGALVGVVAALGSGLTGPVNPAIGRGPLIGYLGIILGMLGGLVGGAIAVLLDRRPERRPQRRNR